MFRIVDSAGNEVGLWDEAALGNALIHAPGTTNFIRVDLGGLSFVGLRTRNLYYESSDCTGQAFTDGGLSTFIQYGTPGPNGSVYYSGDAVQPRHVGSFLTAGTIFNLGSYAETPCQLFPPDTVASLGPLLTATIDSLGLVPPFRLAW